MAGQETKGREGGEQERAKGKIASWAKKDEEEEEESSEEGGDRRWIGTRLTFQGYRTFDNCESFIPLKFQLDSNGLVALQRKENSLPRSRGL